MHTVAALRGVRDWHRTHLHPVFGHSAPCSTPTADPTAPPPAGPSKARRRTCNPFIRAWYCCCCCLNADRTRSSSSAERGGGNWAVVCGGWAWHTAARAPAAAPHLPAGAAGASAKCLSCSAWANTRAPAAGACGVGGTGRHGAAQGGGGPHSRLPGRSWPAYHAQEVARALGQERHGCGCNPSEGGGARWQLERGCLVDRGAGQGGDSWAAQKTPATPMEQVKQGCRLFSSQQSAISARTSRPLLSPHGSPAPPATVDAALIRRLVQLPQSLISSHDGQAAAADPPQRGGRAPAGAALGGGPLQSRGQGHQEAGGGRAAGGGLQGARGRHKLLRRCA